MKKIASIAVIFALLGGCQEMNKKTDSGDKLPTFYEDIVWISLVVDLPMIDEDRDQQPDGAQVRIMLLRSNQPEYVAGKGKVNFYLMKRIKTPAGTFKNIQLYKWTISEEDLARAVVRQRFGFVCHQIALYWANVRPRGNNVYLQAEFIRTDNTRIMSRPVTLALPTNSGAGK